MDHIDRAYAHVASLKRYDAMDRGPISAFPADFYGRPGSKAEPDERFSAPGNAVHAFLVRSSAREVDLEQVRRDFRAARFVPDLDQVFVVTPDSIERLL